MTAHPAQPSVVTGALQGQHVTGKVRIVGQHQAAAVQPYVLGVAEAHHARIAKPAEGYATDAAAI